jgi:hypothetical protein
MGANMRLISGFGCFLWCSVAAVLAPLYDEDAITALAHSHAVLASLELKTTLAEPDARAAIADPVTKVPPAEPEVNVSPLEASDECVLSEECTAAFG